MKLTLKLFAVILSFTLVLSSTVGSISIAETQKLSTNISNIVVDGENLNFTLEEEEYSVDYTYDFESYKGDGFSLVTSTTDKSKNTTEFNTFSYDKNTKIAYLNGEKLNYKTTEYYDPSKSVQEDGFNSFIRFSSNEAVYVSTSKTTFSEQVNSISQLVTVIGGVIAIGFVLGVPGFAGSIPTAVAAWSGVVGIANLAVSKVVSGNVSFDTYRSKDKVFTGMGKYLYQYRYQNCRVYFTLMGHVFTDYRSGVGNWWFAEKPY